MSTRAAVVHFDGDPFLVKFWMDLYNRYWRNEVDKLYVSVGYNPTVVKEEHIEYVKSILDSYPEVVSIYNKDCALPEVGNNNIYPLIKEDLILFTESDNWIFRSGFVTNCFEYLESGYDIVSGETSLFNDYIKSRFKRQAFMRSMFFIKKDLLSLIDSVNFLPANAPEGAGQEGFETFGLLSYKLLRLNPKIKEINANVLSPGTEFNIKSYTNYPYFHIRGMSSSTLGMGGTEYLAWESGNYDRIKEVVAPGNHAEWGFLKAVVFKQIILEEIGEIGQLKDFYKKYQEFLIKVIEELNLPTTKITLFKRFFKGLLHGNDLIDLFIEAMPVMQKPQELRQLIDYLKTKNPKTIVEVGIMSGGTTAVLAQCFPDAKVLGVDCQIETDSLKDTSGYGYDTLKGNSQKEETIRQVQATLNVSKIDFIFIDADHLFEGVKKDYELWHPYAKILGFHDIVPHDPSTHVAVNQVWNIAKEGRSYKEFILQDNPSSTFGWGGIGVIEYE